jgi:hypothetical protein
MLQKKYLFIFSILLLAVGGFFFFYTHKKDTDTTIHTSEIKDVLVKTDERIQLISPKPYDKLVSPLSLSGQARGYWFFEGSFPVELVDMSGKILATSYAQAEAEWMTESFVPFRASFEFLEPSTDIGLLIVRKDNPSGLPENDAFIQIPVRFR